MATARIQELLHEAKKALALRERMALAGDDAGEVDEALRGLYLDLGRALVAAAEAIGDDLRSDPSDPAQGGFPFPGLDPYDDSTPVIPPAREFTAEEPADYVLTTVAQLRADAVSPDSPFHAFRAGSPAWKASLAQLLDLMALPGSFADAGELAIESSRLQWACGQLAEHLQPLPVEIRIGLIGMMAARAHHLRLRLDSDVGPRLSLDRLQRYRLESDLPAVAGLTPTPRPETGSWEGDARQWWFLLAGEEG